MLKEQPVQGPPALHWEAVALSPWLQKAESFGYEQYPRALSITQWRKLQMLTLIPEALGKMVPAGPSCVLAPGLACLPSKSIGFASPSLCSPVCALLALSLPPY